MKILIPAAVALAPQVVLACGGLFCNTAQPVNQAAERILFARDGATLNMHVRISYQGPPTDFGWLLPVPPDVETLLSSEQLFATLDQQLAPIFSLQTVFDENCAQNRADSSPVADGELGGGPEDPQAPGVNVLSREAVGPYDRTILQADNVGVLRAWLDENGYQIPESVDETLEPYIEMGNVFVALKLLPGTDAGDVQPLHLRFTSDTPAIPIVPTRVAANPDMGVIVHVLAGERAIPTNYAHVHVNEATIDWVNQGANYADVVSAAADEAAQGRAWVTDSAGPSEGIVGAIQPYPADLVEAVRAARTLGDLTSVLPLTDADVQRMVGGLFEIPEGVQPNQYFQCPECFGEVDYAQAVDGAQLAERLTTEVNAPREALLALFANNDTLTRLYTTMSPEEMTQDPIFATNPDLNPVDRQRTATSYIFCDDQGRTVPALSYVETPSGLRFQLDENGQVPDVIQRQAGETVRGAGVPAARLIEQMFKQGQPQVISDRTQALRARYQGADGDEGCDCDATSGPAPTSLGLLLLGLLGLRRRRR